MKKLLVPMLFLTPFLGIAQEGGSLQQEYAGVVAYNSGQILSLAEAIPEDVYSYSPSEGVRDLAGVIAHITSANYFFSMMIGNPAEGVDPSKFEEMEMSKEEAVKNLKSSLDQLMASGKMISEEALNEMVEFPNGQTFSKRTVMLIAMGHVAEHKGQMVAYARANEIAPPWSVPAEPEKKEGDGY